MASVDNIMSVITWFFIEILSDVQYLTRNANKVIKLTYKAIKLTFGWNRFSKRTMYNLQNRIYF